MNCNHIAVAREQTPIELMDRVYGQGKTLINQFSLASITYRVFEYSSQEDAEQDEGGTEIGTTGTLAVADVVFDALQAAPPWDASLDPAGYNFRFTLPAARRPAGGVWHRVEIWLTPSTPGHEPYPLVWLIRSTPLASA